jgi:hypothetical protein
MEPSNESVSVLRKSYNIIQCQTEPLGSSLKGLNLLRQDTKVCFYRGRNEEFKDFFSLEDCVVFSMMFVPLWKFLVMNITQISGACSFICQK